MNAFGLVAAIALGSMLATVSKDLALAEAAHPGGAMRDERVTREEVLAEIRAQGNGGVDRVAAVVMETDGSFSVFHAAEAGDGSALPPYA